MSAASVRSAAVHSAAAARAARGPAPARLYSPQVHPREREALQEGVQTGSVGRVRRRRRSGCSQARRPPSARSQYVREMRSVMSEKHVDS